MNGSSEECFPKWPSFRPESRGEEATPPPHRSPRAESAPSGGEPEGPIEPDDDYVSPALRRLERGKPRRSVIRGITEEAVGLPSAPPPRLAELDSRVDGIERHQHQLATNLCDANVAFRRLAERVSELVEQLQQRNSDEAE